MAFAMNRSRRRLLVLLLCLTVGAVVFAVGHRVLQPREPVLFADAYERLELGMTVEEMTAILGRPPGEYARDYRNVYGWTEHGLGRPFGVEHVWEGDDCMIRVRFDQGGKAVRLMMVFPMDRIPYLTYLRYSLPW
jgi:hypothetical protein